MTSHPGTRPRNATLAKEACSTLSSCGWNIIREGPTPAGPEGKQEPPCSATSKEELPGGVSSAHDLQEPTSDRKGRQRVHLMAGRSLVAVVVCCQLRHERVERALETKHEHIGADKQRDAERDLFGNPQRWPSRGTRNEHDGEEHIVTAHEHGAYQPDDFDHIRHLPTHEGQHQHETGPEDDIQGRQRCSQGIAPSRLEDADETKTAERGADKHVDQHSDGANNTDDWKPDGVTFGKFDRGIVWRATSEAVVAQAHHDDVDDTYRREGSAQDARHVCRPLDLRPHGGHRAKDRA
mmetsp:Transcript_46239/g.122118  ORF Transcript_46239/g.122118 Transcript_46239/m.122118 type:complete len:294 (+) Transcript_46239:24-905(+)